LKSTWWTSY